jgi:multiple sugar transport system permease protein
MTVDAAGRGATRRPALRRSRSAATGLAFIAPALIGLTALYLVPLIGTVVLSFSKTGPFGGSTLTGLDNYSELITDDGFWLALRNSAIYTAIVLLGVPIALVVAALIEQVKRGRTLYRCLYFLPVVTLPVAVGMVWRLLYNGEFGPINALLALVGIAGPNWIASPDTAIYAVSVVGIWMSLGTGIIILGAGLRGISTDLFEASALDGASGLRQFFSITLPLLTPSIFFVTVLSVIASLQMFDLIFIMIGPNSPALAGSSTVVYLFYQRAFVETNQGAGAAIAIVLLLIIMAVTAVQFRLQRRWVFYD